MMQRITTGIARRVLLRNANGSRGAHVTRYAMYLRLREVLKPLVGPGKVLSISHSAKFCETLGLERDSIFEANYPEYNLLDLKLADSEFDYVVSDQVLEHVAGDPFQAVRESFRVLRPGGIAVHATCFINPIHNHPSDLWRFTPEALRLLCEPHGDVLEAGGWGNQFVWGVVHFGFRYEPVPDNPANLLHKIAVKNDPLWPIVTWVVARKRESSASL